MIGILYVGKSRFYLKRGNHSFIFIIVKDKTRTIGMPFVWKTDCHSTLFFYHVSNAAITYEKKRELSEYKAIYMIKDYFLLLFQAIQKDTQELSKILIRLFNLLQQNGRKSHRYEKKTVFDILGVVYNCTMSDNQAA